ncbi:MAG: hypothetical protein ACM3O4_06335 [Ignavibacteriales bacterium]
MSYETDVMYGLRQAIRDEIPSLTREIRKISTIFGNINLINALNENAKAQQNSNLLRLCEISMQRPELGLLSSTEIVEILKTVKDNIVEKAQPKEEPKNKRFFK